MVNINFSLDRPNHEYNPGDVINMEVRIQNNSPAKFRTIYVRVYGYAHVEWTESRQVTRNGKTHTEYKTYSSHETYLKDYQTLAGIRSGAEIELSVGSHVYHASFVLPRNLPENHEHDYGHIRYEAKVHMDVPWGFDEKERIDFQVTPRLDLNAFPQLREPVRDAASKTFGCCCWESDPLRIHNVLPRGAFVPGDRVPFSLELNNDSDVSINSATIKLKKKIIYHAYSPSSKTRDSSETLWTHEFNANNDRQLVAALQNKIFSTEIYFDPSMQYNFFDGCGIITVEYYVDSTAHSSGCHTDLHNRTSINMGTVSIMGQYNGTLPSMAPMLPFPSAPPSLPSAPPVEPISQQPLPSYNESVSQPAAAVGWAGMNNSETPPPTFTEIEFENKKGKLEEQEKQ